MKYKWRIGIPLMIGFIFFVSFKILQPDIMGMLATAEKREAHDRSKRFVTDKPQSTHDKGQHSKIDINSTKQAIVAWFVRYYTVDWDLQIERSPWKIATEWVSDRQVHPEFPKELGEYKANTYMHAEFLKRTL